VGIQRLLHSSCCFLNTNTAITWQLIRTARTLEAECWHVCGEAWVRGKRKRSEVLGAFVLLDFTMLRPVLAWRAFLYLLTVNFFKFPFFSGPRPTADNWNHGYGGPPVVRYREFNIAKHILRITKDPCVLWDQKTSEHKIFLLYYFIPW